MKIILLLIVLVFINIINSQMVSVVPYSNSCRDTESVGIGYQLPVSKCVTIGDNNVYIVLSNDNQFIKTYWVLNCTTPNFDDAMVFNYQVDSCAEFNIPFSNGLLSSISINAPTPDNSVSYNYYYQSQNSTACQGPTYQMFYTNGYSFNNENQGSDKYFCKNNVPYVNTCNYNGQCDTINLGGGCQNDYENPYPYTITC